MSCCLRWKTVLCFNEPEFQRMSALIMFMSLAILNDDRRALSAAAAVDDEKVVREVAAHGGFHLDSKTNEQYANQWRMTLSYCIPERLAMSKHRHDPRGTRLSRLNQWILEINLLTLISICCRGIVIAVEKPTSLRRSSSSSSSLWNPKKGE